MTVKDANIYISKPSPGKRLKKRKELNALIGIKTAVPDQKCLLTSNLKMCQDHEVQIEPDSLYSKFSTYRNHKRKGCFRKGYFFFCLLVCVMALIISCVVSSIGIVWMEIQLKHEVLYIKERLKKLDSFAYQETAEIVDIKNRVDILKSEIKEMKSTDNQRIKHTEEMMDSLIDKMPPSRITILENDYNLLNSTLIKMYNALLLLNSQIKPSVLLEMEPKQLKLQQHLNLLSKEILELNNSVSTLLLNAKNNAENSAKENLLPIKKTSKTVQPTTGKTHSTYPDVKNIPKFQESQLPQTAKHVAIKGEVIAKKIMPSVGAREVSESTHLVHDTDTEVGDTTTSFTALPIGNHVVK